MSYSLLIVFKDDVQALALKEEPSLFELVQAVEIAAATLNKENIKNISIIRNRDGEIKEVMRLRTVK